MMRSNWMMAGSSMSYEFDDARGKKLGAYVRLSGSALGIGLEIEERVIEYMPPSRKVWQTTGQPRMVVLDAYRMGFILSPSGGGSRLTVFIDYSKPQAGLNRWLGVIAGDAYARWCVDSMISAAAKRFGPPGVTSVDAGVRRSSAAR
jgi:hypothetical protein